MLLIEIIIVIPDSRHSNAENPYTRGVQSVIQDCNTFISYPPLNVIPHQRTTRNDIINYGNQQTGRNNQPIFWTLPKRNVEVTSHRSITPEILSDCRPISREIHTLNEGRAYDESIHISPIDPRTSGSFKSSTPSNKDNIVNLGSKLLSPVKSSMTNEELYAVIHKSKKKLNIKDSADRSSSPALSAVSLSPVSSETSLVTKISQRQPETGYLSDARNRNSWAYSSENQALYQGIGNRGSIGSKIESTCADRFGPLPQTSRLDFKKLLLQHSVKSNTLNHQNRPNKLSAVEQLKLSKDRKSVTSPVPISSNTSNVNILDLSGSPKTYNQRKFNKGNLQPASPSRTNSLIKEYKSTPKILLSPKSQWRFSSPRSDVLSSPIPEANNEDDNSNSSGEKVDSSPNKLSPKTVPIVTNKHFGARRSLIPINENTTELDYNLSENQGVFPLTSELPKVQSLSRAEMLQAKRAEFFNSPPDSSPPRFSSFKSGSTVSSSKNPSNSDGGKSSPTLETAL